MKQKFSAILLGLSKTWAQTHYNPYIVQYIVFINSQSAGNKIFGETFVELICTKETVSFPLTNYSLKSRNLHKKFRLVGKPNSDSDRRNIFKKFFRIEAYADLHSENKCEKPIFRYNALGVFPESSGSTDEYFNILVRTN